MIDIREAIQHIREVDIFKPASQEDLFRRKEEILKKFEQNKQGFLKNPETCPFCMSEGAIPTPEIFDYDNVHQGILRIGWECDECEGKWVEHYKLFDISAGVT